MEPNPAVPLAPTGMITEDLPEMAAGDALQPPQLPPRQRQRSGSGEGPTRRPRASSSANAKPAVMATPNDDLALYYAHLQKHLRQVKRIDHARIAKPKRETFLIKLDDNVEYTDWAAFAKAWIEYIVNSFASEKIDETIEPFSLSVMKGAVDRLYPLVLPFKAPFLKLRSIYRWENKWLTGIILCIYLVLWYYDVILAALCFWFFGYIVSVRMEMMAQYGVEALATEETEEQASKSSKQWQFWKRLRSDTSPHAHLGFSVLENKSIHEWTLDVKNKYGPYAQLLLIDIVDRLERLKNLVTWKNPSQTRLFAIFVGVWGTTMLVLPTRYTVKMFFFYLGVEFFVLQALRSNYPRYRRLFNVMDWFLWGVPNDAEYALEVIRLKYDKDPSSRQVASSPDLLATTNKPAEEMVAERTTSAAATLAAMVAGAAAEQVRLAINQKLQPKEGELLTKGSAFDTSGLIETFGCIYKGSIPGRIVISKHGFQFRTSRMTGARTLVHYPWSDIGAVCKTKSLDLLVWKANGLELTTKDGEKLHFENVIKRDECFSLLLALSNDKWKQM